MLAKLINDCAPWWQPEERLGSREERKEREQGAGLRSVRVGSHVPAVDELQEAVLLPGAGHLQLKGGRLKGEHMKEQGLGREA